MDNGYAERLAAKIIFLGGVGFLCLTTMVVSMVVYRVGIPPGVHVLAVSILPFLGFALPGIMAAMCAIIVFLLVRHTRIDVVGGPTEGEGNTIAGMVPSRALPIYDEDTGERVPPPPPLQEAVYHLLDGRKIELEALHPPSSPSRSVPNPFTRHWEANVKDVQSGWELLPEPTRTILAPSPDPLVLRFRSGRYVGTDAPIEVRWAAGTERSTIDPAVLNLLDGRDVELEASGQW